jgi:hypothetical protein
MVERPDPKGMEDIYEMSVHTEELQHKNIQHFNHI